MTKPTTHNSEAIELPDYIEHSLLWENLGIEQRIEHLKNTLEEVINYLRKDK